MSQPDSPLEGPADLSRSAVSRYIQLATLFRRRIETGQWAVGGQVPIVDDLAAEHGVARATIRQALGLLEAEGLIERFRAKGTFVRRTPQDDRWCEVETDLAGLMNARPGAEIELLSQAVVERPPLIPHPIGELTPAYRHLRRRHWRKGSPFLLADVYIDEALCRTLPPGALVEQSAMRLAASLADVRIADARQTLTLGAADVETARQLELPLNAPIAQVNRSVLDQHGRLVLIANGLYRGDVFRLDMRLK